MTICQGLLLKSNLSLFTTNDPLRTMDCPSLLPSSFLPLLVSILSFELIENH